MRLFFTPSITRVTLILTLFLPLPLAAQLSASVEPGSDAHKAQIERFRTPGSNNSRLVSNGDHVLSLPLKATDFSDLRYAVEDRTYSIEDFMEHNHVAGLLVLKNGEVRLERYGLGNDEDSVWISYSMAKSVTSMLYGAAIADGYITNLDAKVTDYLPAMKGSAYDGATLRNLLQMASGVQWNETYSDPNSDVGNYPGGDVVEMMKFLGAKPRVAAPGEVFNYSTGETDLAGVVLRAAIGNNLSTYLTHKIWMHMMEDPAYWATHGEGGGERGGCCIYATLRDYGRLGLFAMNDGVLPDGTRVLPEGWMAESTAPSPASDGYGYFWWLDGGGVFRASGIYGQGIYFNPASETVIVVLSAWTAASGGDWGAHRNRVFRAIDEFLN
ncbi:MAG: serine hydrolase domain-containing protein [Pseudohongiellaceae bacterium]